MLSLVETKLHPPILPVRCIQRPDLILRLNEGLDLRHQLTLVSAPAGYGKTTCINEWVNTLSQGCIAWLSLESADDDPGRFFNYLFAVLQKADLNLAGGIADLISAGQLPPAEIISSALINDLLADSERIMLVLDDFHVIQDNFIFKVIEQVMTNSPERFHLVLITREDPPLPLARLRANNQMTEIRARDLRFSSRDIDLFLKVVIGLSLNQADIKTLEAKTEGWIAGVQLAGLSLRDKANPSGFITSLRGNHRFILGYLTEQVLNQQPSEICQFLLETSILDTLNGGLCDKVTGRSNSSAVLEQLFKANLFLIPMDEERHWYRYHYLFADLLGDLLKATNEDRVCELHQRASAWYAQAGMLNEAIRHALLARDFAVVVDLLEKHAMEMIMQGFAKTVDTWVQSLPKEWILQSAKTNLAFTWALLLRGEYSRTIQYLERLRGIFINSSPGGEGASLKAEWLVIQSLLLYMQGKTTECMELASRAMELTPEINYRVWSLAFYVQASIFRLHGEYDEAIRIYQQSIRYCVGTETLFAEIMSTLILANMAFERGQLYLALKIASRAVKQAELAGKPYPISAVIYASLGEVYYQWCQTDKAREHFQKALYLSKLGGVRTGTLMCHVLLSRLAQIEGKLNISESQIQQAADLTPLEAPDYIRQEVVSQQVRTYLAFDQLDSAELALKSSSQISNEQFPFIDFPQRHEPSATPGESVSPSLLLLYNSHLLVMLYRARIESDPAGLKKVLEATNRVIEWSMKNKVTIVALETRLIRAQVSNLLGNYAASTEDYLKALDLGEPGGIIATFLERGKTVEKDLREIARKSTFPAKRMAYIQRILAEFKRCRPSAETTDAENAPIRDRQAGLIEPLSDRELEVLSLISEGLKYREVGLRLFISQNTVRFHIKSIYGKLEVNNRTQAVHKAHQLRIL